jgi:hypothetical protein
MRVIVSSEWDAARASGQARLVMDLWLESVSTDVTPAYWPPLCSTLQLLHNLRSILQESDTGVLKPYHARDAAAEILDRAEGKPWLVEQFPAEWEVVKTELQEVSKAEDGKVDVRRRARLLVGAFVDKAEASDPIRAQLERLKALALEPKTSFDVLSRGVCEVTNDLVHRGHSRDFLHDWLLGNVLPDNGQAYLDNLTSAAGLGNHSAADYSVLFGTFAPKIVPGSDRIQFVNSVPDGWELPGDSPLWTGNHRFAIVKVAGHLDWQAAIGRARSDLTRYLNSTHLARFRFDRKLSDAAAARHDAKGQAFHQRYHRGLRERSISGAERFYELRQIPDCNIETYAELDRVMYWYEQSRGWDDLGRLIALWTALEFLFGQLDESAVRGIQTGLPAYVIPQYARLLVLDLRAMLNRIELVWPPETLAVLDGTAEGGRLKTLNLQALLEAACEEDAAHKLYPVVGDYPNVVRKIRRIYRLKHPFKKSTDHPAVWHDVAAFEQGMLYDLQFAYRARNEIVHAAAVRIVQLDRLVQRLNWMVCTTMDVLIYQFASHPKRTLRELHEANIGSFRLWKETLKSGKLAVPLADILKPVCHGLPTTAGGPA